MPNVAKGPSPVWRNFKKYIAHTGDVYLEASQASKQHKENSVNYYGAKGFW